MARQVGRMHRCHPFDEEVDRVGLDDRLPKDVTVSTRHSCT